MTSLTHLLNRRAIMDVLASELGRAAREPNPLTVMMVDIDHFKSVNDKFGHLAGDGVLCEVSRRLRASIRTYDNVGRFGGEEFLVVAPGSDTAPGLAQAERLREVVCSQPIAVKDISINVTISVGVATSHQSPTARLWRLCSLRPTRPSTAPRREAGIASKGSVLRSSSPLRRTCPWVSFLNSPDDPGNTLRFLHSNKPAGDLTEDLRPVRKATAKMFSMRQRGEGGRSICL